MFWKLKIEVQSGDAFETLLTDASPRANARESPYKNRMNRIWGETEVSVTL